MLLCIYGSTYNTIVATIWKYMKKKHLSHYEMIAVRWLIYQAPIFKHPFQTYCKTLT